ncbi:MAG: hypothetical protein P4M09_24420 [Devosia sp.]|nr:hypothetical protein [Devosia sp.]
MRLANPQSRTASSKPSPAALEAALRLVDDGIARIVAEIGTHRLPPAGAPHGRRRASARAPRAA